MEKKDSHMAVADIFIRLIRCALSGAAPERSDLEGLSEEQLQELAALAKKHDLLHLAGAALELADLPDKSRFERFQQAELSAMFRYQLLHSETVKLCRLLEESRIPYIPLKGSVLRGLYPEPWYRTSCDVDILVPEDRLQEAQKVIENRLNYQFVSGGNHHVSLRLPGSVLLELHFDIHLRNLKCEELWQDAKSTSGEGYRCDLSAEMTILYHLAHMANHFLNGGCGVRPFLDLWLMRRHMKPDEALLARMLQEHGLAAFGEMSYSLAEVWLDGKTPDSILLTLQEYILLGGAYGTLSNGIRVAHSGKIGEAGYLRSRLFLPAQVMSTIYPILQRYPVLLPLCWIRRWIRLLFEGKLERLSREHRMYRSISETSSDSMQQLMDSLGLNQ